MVLPLSSLQCRNYITIQLKFKIVHDSNNDSYLISPDIVTGGCHAESTDLEHTLTQTLRTTRNLLTTVTPSDFLLLLNIGFYSILVTL